MASCLTNSYRKSEFKIFFMVFSNRYDNFDQLSCFGSVDFRIKKLYEVLFWNFIKVLKCGTCLNLSLIKYRPFSFNAVLSSDFPGLRTSAASTTSMSSMTFTASFHQTNYCSWWLDTPWQANGPFLWNGSSKIQIFTDISTFFCQRLMRPGDDTFLKTGWWNSNVQTSWSH